MPYATRLVANYRKNRPMHSSGDLAPIIAGDNSPLRLSSYTIAERGGVCEKRQPVTQRAAHVAGMECGHPRDDGVRPRLPRGERPSRRGAAVAGGAQGEGAVLIPVGEPVTGTRPAGVKVRPSKRKACSSFSMAHWTTMAVPARFQTAP